MSLLPANELGSPPWDVRVQSPKSNCTAGILGAWALAANTGSSHLRKGTARSSGVKTLPMQRTRASGCIAHVPTSGKENPPKPEPEKRKAHVPVVGSGKTLNLQCAGVRRGALRILI